MISTFGCIDCRSNRNEYIIIIERGRYGPQRKLNSPFYNFRQYRELRNYGYKRSDVEFSSMVLEQRSSAYSAGGVRVDAFKDVGAVGSMISTGNATDIAVAGRGLFPVTDLEGINQLATERTLQLVPTGSFTADENGNLRTQSGLFLLGWPADTSGDIGNVSRNSGTNLEPVNISTSQFTASPTSSIDIGINLPADATNAGATTGAFTLPIEYYDNLGRSNHCAWR